MIEFVGGNVVLVSFFHNLQFFFGGHFVRVGEGHDISNIGFVFIEGAVELSCDVFILVFFGVPGNLDVSDGAELDPFEGKLEPHES